MQQILNQIYDFVFFKLCFELHIDIFADFSKQTLCVFDFLLFYFLLTASMGQSLCQRKMTDNLAKMPFNWEKL